MIFIHYFILTVLIELAAAWALGNVALKRKNSWHELMGAILGANCISYPCAWSLFIYLQSDYSWPTAFVLTEMAVVFIEAIILKVQLIGTINDGLLVSLCINSVSATLGVISCIIFFPV